jgi:ribokinase
MPAESTPLRYTACMDEGTSGGVDQGGVCVVGSVNMDLVVRVQRLPGVGETVLGSGYRTYPGGKGANQAVAARRAGAPAALIASVGDDAHGHRVRQALENEGINLTGLVVRKGETTGLGLVTVAEGGENVIVVSPGANASLTPDDVVQATGLIQSAAALLVQLEIPLPSVTAAIMIAREAGKTVLLNASPARQVPTDLLRKVDVLVVNRAEGARLVGMDLGADPARIAVRLPDLGPSTIVLTLGAQGSVLIHRGRPRRFPAPHVESVDTTGSSDAFCGALAASWPVVSRAGARSAEELALAERAVLFATAAGALATTRPGAIPSLPARADVEAMGKH